MTKANLDRLKFWLAVAVVLPLLVVWAHYCGVPKP